MRLALILIALLALSTEARADVFVPADPPVLRSAYCVAGAGDVVAGGSTSGPLRVSVGGGGWRVLGGLLGCPVVAGASDGTTAVVAYGREAPDGADLVVRPGGGSFGTPIALGTYSLQAPVVAVAPGGWVAVVWDALDTGLTALVVRPDGTAARTVLEPAGDEAGFVSSPQAAIDAGGNTTFAWQRTQRRGSRLRVARGVAGGPPVPGADLPGKHDLARGLSLAVAPSGRSLIAWASDDGVRAMVDGQAPQVLGGPAEQEMQLATAIADDGTALLAWLGTGKEVVAAEWTEAAWRAPRVLAQGHTDANGFGGEDDPSESVLLASVAAGGRGTVAWSTPRRGDRNVHAASGTIGGTWTAAARLSSVTRAAGPPSLSVDAAGVPRVLWSEVGLGVRGAALAPARLDALAPEVAARLPSHVPPTALGRVRVDLRVQCSEACDARLAFTGGEHDRGSAVMALAAGRTGTLRLRGSDELEYELIVSRRARRLPLQLLVTDRAGNVVRRSVVLRVRVLEPPIRTFKVTLGHRFGMETRAGDRAVARLVNDMIETISRGHVSTDALSRQYARGFRAVARKFGTDSTYSDEVQSAIYDALWVPLARTHHDIGFVLDG